MESHENPTNRPQAHRVYTLFRNLTFALFPALLALCAGGDGMFYAGGIFLFVAVMALMFPVRQDEPLDGVAKVFFGFFGGIGLLVLLGFVLGVGLFAVKLGWDFVRTL